MYKMEIILPCQLKGFSSEQLYLKATKMNLSLEKGRLF